MNLFLASRNEGKRREVAQILEPLGFSLRTPEEAGAPPGIEFPEDGDTFEDNALSKARALRALTGGWCLADDSGLEVDALGGSPGVRSARYAGCGGAAAERDRANLEKLLRELAGVAAPRRTARFVCVVALIGPDGAEIVARGECPGEIIETPRGRGGFGYDPVFVPHGYDRTMAELAPAEKNLISHRGRALRRLAERLRQSGIMASGAGG